MMKSKITSLYFIVTNERNYPMMCEITSAHTNCFQTDESSILFRTSLSDEQ